MRHPLNRLSSRGFGGTIELAGIPRGNPPANVAGELAEHTEPFRLRGLVGGYDAGDVSQSLRSMGGEAMSTAARPSHEPAPGYQQPTTGTFNSFSIASKRLYLDSRSDCVNEPAFV